VIGGPGGMATRSRIETPDRPHLDRTLINGIYRNFAARDQGGRLRYSDEQNVSSDIIGLYRVAASIEGHETFTRTATVSFDLSLVVPADVLGRLPETRLEVPITKAVIYGWYDNELGS
jgi:glyceraldehyde 3-phosphate dehydrogenase (phosphorylating)